jgi:signal transduction histidine kinase/CheY-like chemotaxis protein
VLNRTGTAGYADVDSDALLAAYQLLIETTLESGTDEVLLQRALAVLAAVPWLSHRRSLSALLPTAADGSLQMVAATAGVAAPHCPEAAAAACFCGRALLQTDRLICVAAAAQPDRPPCDPGGTGLHLVLPLAARGRVQAVLHVLVDPDPAPGERERSFLVQAARLLGAELHRRRDEREHDRLESQFLQAQKMEAVGRLAGGVAHDFNNILTAITNHADLGLLKLPAESPLRRHFEEIIASADRAAQLTQQLLAFSRRQILAPRVIDINTVVAELGKTLRRLLGADIELTIATDAKPARIMADPVLIEQVVINLAVCARDAMPRGGTLVVAIEPVEFDASYTLAHPAVTPGAYICLSLSAGGAGMDTHFLDALGSPRDAPLHSRDEATLGPAAIKDIIQQGGGHALLEPARGEAVTARINFPAVEGAAPVAAPGESTFQLPRGTETILLVEDDDSMRVVMGEVLRDLGYQVLEAREGREALTLAAEHAGDIDILLTDVVLPGFGGQELLHRLAAVRPGMRVLFIAGIMDDAPDLREGAGPGQASLRKPFSPWSLALRLRRVLDAPSPS